MPESPKVGSFFFFLCVYPDGIRIFDFPESVKVELADEA